MPGKRAERLQVMLTIDEVRRVEEWRFEHRMPSRSAAVRALMNLGLQAKASAVDESALLEGAVSSRDVGVVENKTFVAPGAEAGERRPPVLVVASEFLVGQGIRRVLEEAGFQVVGPASGHDEAHSLAEANDIVAAVIDARAGDDAVAGTADRLAERDVPFLIIGGDDPERPLPERHRAAPMVSRQGVSSNLARLVSGLVA